MLKYYIFIAIMGVFTSSSAFAADASTFQTYVPRGWKLLSSTNGDLNTDGKDDAAIVIEKDDPANRKQNSSLGSSELNLNPRRLLILFQKEDNYQIMLSTDKFLPTENDEESPCLADPLGENGIKISKGLLKITLGYWMSCGGWGTSSEEYLFRYENARFRLIGHNHHDFMRNSGEGTESSANYLTGKIKVIEGMNEFDEKASKPKTVWKKIKNNDPKYLDEVTSSSLLEEQYWRTQAIVRMPRA